MSSNNGSLFIDYVKIFPKNTKIILFSFVRIASPKNNQLLNRAWWHLCTQEIRLHWWAQDSLDHIPQSTGSWSPESGFWGSVDSVENFFKRTNWTLRNKKASFNLRCWSARHEIYKMDTFKCQKWWPSIVRQYSIYDGKFFWLND